MAGKLYRSRTDSMLGGVCGGLGQYLEVDPTLIRLVFLVAVLSGVGVMLYLAMWIIVPRAGQEGATAAEIRSTGAEEITEHARSLRHTLREHSDHRHNQSTVFLGGALVLMGAVFLAQELHIWWISVELMWPALLILGGVLLIQRRTRTT